jgi:hypothetical protein
MTSADIALAALFVGLYLAFRIVTRPHFRWSFLSATAVAMLVYAAHVMIGGIVLALAVSRDPPGAAGYFVAFAGWFGFGVLDLIRMVPRHREPPAFLMKPGIADAICLIVIVVGLALAWG